MAVEEPSKGYTGGHFEGEKGQTQKYDLGMAYLASDKKENGIEFWQGLVAGLMLTTGFWVAFAIAMWLILR